MINLTKDLSDWDKTPLGIAFNAYRDSIPSHLWDPLLAEGFFEGWDAATAISPDALPAEEN